MPLWGKQDRNLDIPKYVPRGQIIKVNITNGGTGYATAPTVTILAPASGTQATATATVSGGVVTAINITNPGDGYTASDVATVSFAGGGGSNAAAVVVKAPIVYDADWVYFVDNIEAKTIDAKAIGMTSPGWWLYRTFTDAQSNVRHKSELLVHIFADPADSGDRDDDDVLPDGHIIITSQPVDTEIEEEEVATFIVAFEPFPDDLDVDIQWQVSTDDGDNWSNLSNSAVYDGVATDTLDITTTDTSLDGNWYRAVLSATGVTTVYSNPAILTVTAA